jgi:hypothetical protein
VKINMPSLEGASYNITFHLVLMLIILVYYIFKYYNLLPPFKRIGPPPKGGALP